MSDHSDPIAPNAPNAPCAPTRDGRCALCADEAERGRVREVDVRAMLARVVIGARIETVALDLVDDVAAGDVLLVHQGFAIGRVTAVPEGA